MTAIIVVGCIVGYFAIGTLVGVKAYMQSKRRRELDLASKKGDYSSIDPSFNGATFGALWPVCIWLMLGIVLVGRAERREAECRRLNEEREKLLAEARAELERL